MWLSKLINLFSCCVGISEKCIPSTMQSRFPWWLSIWSPGSMHQCFPIQIPIIRLYNVFCQVWGTKGVPQFVTLCPGGIAVQTIFHGIKFIILEPFFSWWICCWQSLTRCNYALSNIHFGQMMFKMILRSTCDAEHTQWDQWPVQWVWIQAIVHCFHYVHEAVGKEAFAFIQNSLRWTTKFSFTAFIGVNFSEFWGWNT